MNRCQPYSIALHVAHYPNMLYYLDEEQGTVYWVDAHGEFCFAPFCTDNTFDSEESGSVELYGDDIDEEKRTREIEAFLRDRWSGKQSRLKKTDSSERN